MSLAAPTFLELATWADDERATWLASLTGEELLGLQRAWWFNARPDQLWHPGPETWTVACAGRGWGKTRWAVETCLAWAVTPVATDGHMLFVGATGFDVAATMLYGKSGFMTLGQQTPGMRVRHYKGRYEVVKVEGQQATGRWSETCAIRLASAEVPDRIRGPDVGRAWYDELGAFHLERDEANVWAQRRFVLRSPVAGGPKGLVSMTPRANAAVRDLYADCYEPRCTGCGRQAPRSAVFELRRCAGCGAEFWPDIRIITGSTYDNAANLAEEALANINRLKGTRLYEQEAHGRLIEDIEGALFHQHTFQFLRSELRRGADGGQDTHEQLVRRELGIHMVVVAVDPSGSTSKTACESGVVVVGKQGYSDTTAVVCEDATVRPEDVPAGKTMASTYARAAVLAAMRWGAEFIVIETNYGGDAVVQVLQSTVDIVWAETGCLDPKPRVIDVWAHASKSKRAEFMSVEQEAGRVHYLVMHGEDGRTKYALLIASATGFSPHDDTSKRDRLDAMVHGHKAIHDPSAGGGTGWLPVMPA